MFWAEVKKMLLTEYNEKKYMRLLRAAALEEGREEGRREGEQNERSSLIRKMLQNGCSAEEAAKLTGLSQQEIQDVLQKRS